VKVFYPSLQMHLIGAVFGVRHFRKERRLSLREGSVACGYVPKPSHFDLPDLYTSIAICGFLWESFPDTFINHTLFLSFSSFHFTSFKVYLHFGI
jgi:hypothetical protein